MHKREITDKQFEVYAYMLGYYFDNDQLPPIAKIADRFGTCDNAAHDHVIGLEVRGWLERNENGKFRFARPLRGNNVNSAN